MTDQDHAATIKALVDALNDVVKAAAMAGLTIDLMAYPPPPPTMGPKGSAGAGAVGAPRIGVGVTRRLA